MTVFKTKRELQKFALDTKRAGKTIGLVPTMGFLHEGHASLIDIAREKADVVIVSVFVNPTQFAPNEDFDSYPRDFERDAKLCEAHGVDVVIAPEPQEKYCSTASTFVTETMLSRPLCGASRPTFFRGVTTVVSKLFNLALPDFAVFGEKDAQQLHVIRRMVRDLDFPVEIIAGKLVRDADGLATSSRNRYLSADERERALAIHRALLTAKRTILADRGAIDAALEQAKQTITLAGGKVDYVSALYTATFDKIAPGTRRIIVAAAAFFGTTRLIDNEMFDF
ncbi:MAG: pantoate--beta-alanine ligase [Victivallaceae bacterium]|nr:pantoate--beta-alanine ligase [Victivallaceae bacterium]